MGHVHQEILIEAPIGEVYELALDVNRQREWNPYMEVSNISGPVDQVGTTFDSVMHLLGVTTTSKGTVVAVEPMRLIHLRGQGDNGWSDWTYRFEPLGDATRCTLDVDYELTGRIGAALDRLVFHGAFERATRHMAENFKAVAETRVPLPA